MGETKTPVLVTTEHRGVFFGYLVGQPAKAATKLSSARNCIQWSSDVKGFLGLASGGPTGNCRVGPSVPKLTVYDVTSVAECTSEAAEAWERAPWK